jgi:hypothetical protein
MAELGVRVLFSGTRTIALRREERVYIGDPPIWHWQVVHT